MVTYAHSKPNIYLYIFIYICIKYMIYLLSFNSDLENGSDAWEIQDTTGIVTIGLNVVKNLHPLFWFIYFA